MGSEQFQWRAITLAEVALASDEIELALASLRGVEPDMEGIGRLPPLLNLE